MKRILVPTDFSTNSKAGIRFAIHWASQQKIELVFVHVLHVFRELGWTNAEYASKSKAAEAECRVAFEKFIHGIYNNLNIKPGKHSFLILQGLSPDIILMDYCRKQKDIDCICISTHGAGRMERLLGTNTGNLITKSTTPVLAIPKNNRVQQVEKVLYATDLKNYPAELKKVAAFSAPFKAAIEVLHFTWPYEKDLDEKAIEAEFRKQYKYGLNLSFKKNDAVHSLIENIQGAVKAKKPSMVVMFTNQDRTFFQKLFLSSKAEQLSFQLKIPLLVFNKPKN